MNGKSTDNGMENFWSLLKRAVKGTYVSVEPFHLFRYVDEQAFRYNNRKLDDSERFTISVEGDHRQARDLCRTHRQGGRNRKYSKRQGRGSGGLDLSLVDRRFGLASTFLRYARSRRSISECGTDRACRTASSNRRNAFGPSCTLAKRLDRLSLILWYITFLLFFSLNDPNSIFTLVVEPGSCISKPLDSAISAAYVNLNPIWKWLLVVTPKYPNERPNSCIILLLLDFRFSLPRMPSIKLLCLLVQMLGKYRNRFPYAPYDAFGKLTGLIRRAVGQMSDA